MEAKIGRNDPCPCGSGRKYKRCCQAAHESAAREARKLEQAQAAAHVHGPGCSHDHDHDPDDSPGTLRS